MYWQLSEQATGDLSSADRPIKNCFAEHAGLTVVSQYHKIWLRN